MYPFCEKLQPVIIFPLKTIALNFVSEKSISTTQNRRKSTYILYLDHYDGNFLLRKRICLWQVFIAMLVDNFLYPISAFRSHFSQSINWSGIRYYLKDGKINKVCPQGSFVNLESVSFPILEVVRCRCTCLSRPDSRF